MHVASQRVNVLRFYYKPFIIYKIGERGKPGNYAECTQKNPPTRSAARGMVSVHQLLEWCVVFRRTEKIEGESPRKGSPLIYLRIASAPKKAATKAEIATKYVGAMSPTIPAAVSSPKYDVKTIANG